MRRELGILDGQLAVLFVGYDWERKGVGQLVAALSALAAGSRTTAPMLLLVGGRGDLLSEQAILTSLKGRVRFLGPREDLPRIYGAADVCVLPSDQESFGMPILEAMACSLPTIVSKCAGVAEVITGGWDGILLDDPRNVSELTAKLLALLSSKQLRPRSAAARG